MSSENATTNTHAPEEGNRHARLPGFVDFKTFILVLQIVFSGVTLPIVVVGVLANLVNVTVFLKIGLKDSVIITFLTLSLSDFIYLLLISFSYTCMTLNLFGVRTVWGVSLAGLGNYFSFYQVTLYDYSCVVTAYMAIARCCCVTLALRFRSLFTVFRTYAVLAGMFVVVTALHIPAISKVKMAWVQQRGSNDTTIYSYLRLPGFDAAIAFHDVVNRNIVGNGSLAIVIICLIALSRALHKASAFRRKTANQMKSAPRIDSHSPNESSEAKSQAEEKLGRKEVQVIKSVSFISAIFVSAAMIANVNVIARQIFPEFQFGGRYNNTAAVMMTVTTTSTFLNSSINIVVYFFFNTKYRETLLRLVRRA